MLKNLVKLLSDPSSLVRCVVFGVLISIIGYFVITYYVAIDSAKTSKIEVAQKDGVIAKVVGNLAIFKADREVAGTLAASGVEAAKVIHANTASAIASLNAAETGIEKQYSMESERIKNRVAIPNTNQAVKPLTASSVEQMLLEQDKEHAISRARITAIWDNFCTYAPEDTACKKRQ